MHTKFLVCVDGSDNSWRAFQYAADKLARPGDYFLLLSIAQPVRDVGLDLYESQVVGADKGIREQMEKAMYNKQELVIKECEQYCRCRGINTTAIHRSGDAREEIVAAAEEYDSDLVVIGSRGLNPIARLLLGSVSEYVMHHFGGAVVVVK